MEEDLTLKEFFKEQASDGECNADAQRVGHIVSCYSYGSDSICKRTTLIDGPFLKYVPSPYKSASYNFCNRSPQQDKPWSDVCMTWFDKTFIGWTWRIMSTKLCWNIAHTTRMNLTWSTRGTLSSFRLQDPLDSWPLILRNGVQNQEWKNVELVGSFMRRAHSSSGW